jgi:hypothetical protein
LASLPTLFSVIAPGCSSITYPGFKSEPRMFVGLLVCTG